MMNTEPIKLRKYSVNITAMVEEIIQRNTVFVPDDENADVSGKVKLHGCSLEDIEHSVMDQLIELVNEVRDKPLSKVDTKNR